jgi:DNA gyrase/topoisomerase IV subunit A
VPEEPSRIRVRTWRQLKSLGALYPQMSFCVLPDSPAIRRKIEQLAASLKDYGPKIMLEARATQSTYLRTLVTLFKEEIDKEYRELTEECEEFLEEIKKNLDTGNITQTEVSELEEALDGLQRWFTKIKSRDFTGSAVENQTRLLLKRCENALLNFSERAEPRRIAETSARGVRR